MTTANDFKEAEKKIIEAGDYAVSCALLYRHPHDLINIPVNRLKEERDKLSELYNRIEKLNKEYFFDNYPNFQKFKDYTLSALGRIKEELSKKCLDGLHKGKDLENLFGKKNDNDILKKNSKIFDILKDIKKSENKFEDIDKEVKDILDDYYLNHPDLKDENKDNDEDLEEFGLK